MINLKNQPKNPNENISLKHKLLNVNTTQETKMVKGSLHFHIKIIYVSLYTQLIYR